LAEKESFFWGWIWDAPFLGEYIIQPVVLLFPGLCFVVATGIEEDSGPASLFVSVLEIAWLWAFERLVGRRLVVPLIPIPWLWVFIAAAAYSILVIVGLAEYS
jgi:hypothetical protein